MTQDNLECNALPRALAERVLLGHLLKLALFALLMALGVVVAPDSTLLQLIKWALLLAMGYGVIKIPESTWTAALSARKATLRESAIEITHGDYTRIIVFGSLRHVKMIQAKDERVLALELHTEDDTIILRDLTNLERLFGAICAQRPKEAMIEVEESHLDKLSPKTWAIAAIVIAILCGLILNNSLDRQTTLKLNGLLFLSSGLTLSFLRPLSQGSDKKWLALEVACGTLLALLGSLILAV